MWKPGFTDTLECDGKQGRLSNSIFETYLKYSGHLKIWQSVEAELAHTYFADWIIINERLHLARAECLIDGLGVFEMLRRIFPDQSEPIPCDWHSGDIEVEIASVDVSCTSNLCTGKLLISLVDGKVISFWEMKKRLTEAEKYEVACREAFLGL